MTALNDPKAVEAAVRKAVAETTITDIHTHLFPPGHGKLLLWGADEVLTYHYLVAELFTLAPRDLTPEKFWVLPKRAQADLVWEHVFLRHGPLSEAARGALTVFSRLGLDVTGRDLASIRRYFDEQNAEDYMEKVFELAGLDYAVMTNNPFVAEEVDCWQAKLPVPARLKTALRIDTLLCDWPAACKRLGELGYTVYRNPSTQSLVAARLFLNEWIERLKPTYLAASLPQDFAYPSEDISTAMLDQVVVPAARENGIPLALMIGVRRGVNPALKDGGDGVGVADVSALQRLLQNHKDAKFLATFLSRVNQHELCVLARKFGNLHLFGCWWFCNNPSIIEELTRMRLELLGTAMTCQHSDARVLDQLIYKWTHTRQIVADVLVDKYRNLCTTGWQPTEDEIRRDVRAIFGGSFEEFLAK